jgi:hypothetical protein
MHLLRHLRLLRHCGSKLCVADGLHRSQLCGKRLLSRCRGSRVWRWPAGLSVDDRHALHNEPGHAVNSLHSSDLRNLNGHRAHSHAGWQPWPRLQAHLRQLKRLPNTRVVLRLLLA